ncbi:XRE family transcriptional regulator [Pseudonocardia kunmingensis]|nr:XRE family transcriptional regulator [Pseudonocardia kunmingensis]
MPADFIVATPAARVALNRDRQRAIYGVPLSTLVHGILEDYGISQARLARTLGVSTAALSQLVRGSRIKIGDQLAQARLLILEQRRDQARALTDPAEVGEILADVARIERSWVLARMGVRDCSGCTPASLCRVASSEDLAAAADALDNAFPAIASTLRQAAGTC